MYCIHCGKELPDEAKFCFGCGKPVIILPEAPEKARPAAPASSQAPRAASMTAPERAQAAAPASRQVTRAAAAVPAAMPAKKRQVAAAPAVRNEAAVNLPKISFADRTEGSSFLRRFYVVDFIVRMAGIKENIPLFIYLLLNVRIISALVSLFTQLNIGFGLLIGFVLYIISMTVALSPFGEWLLRGRAECKQIDDPEVAERIEPLFYEVYMAAKQRDPSLPDDIKLFMNEDKFPNAFATGRRTVCVSRGLLIMSDEEIRAALGHEFGHLSHKDTDRILVVTIGNAFITAICVLAQIGAMIGEVMCNIMAIFMGEEGILVTLMAAFSRFMTIVLINLFMKVWNWIGVMLCMKTSRGNEYQADEFSYHLGYGPGLASLLTFFSKCEKGEKPTGLFATLASSHPEPADRISRLQHLMQYR